MAKEIKRMNSNRITNEQRRKNRSFIHDMCCIFNNKTHWHGTPYYKEDGDAVILDSYYDMHCISSRWIYKLFPKRLFPFKFVKGKYTKLYLQHSDTCSYNNKKYDNKLLENGLNINIVSVCNTYDYINLPPEDQELILEIKLKLLGKTLKDCTKITFGKLKGYYLEMLPIYSDTCNRILLKSFDVVYDKYSKNGGIYKDQEKFTGAILKKSPNDLLKSVEGIKKYLEWMLINVDFLPKEDRVKIRNITKLYDNLRKTNASCSYTYSSLSDDWGAFSSYDEDLADVYSMVMYDGCGACI